MENIKSKPLSVLIFIPLLCLIFIRPLVSGLAYPAFEFWYEILIITFAILTIINRRGGFNIPNSYIVPVLLLLTAYIISTITSVSIQNSIKETLKLISYIAVFFIVLQTDADQKKIIIKSLVIAASIISVYSIYQYAWGYQHTIDYIKKTDNNMLFNSWYAKDILLSKRAIGTFPSPNILGGYLIMIFFLPIAIAKDKISDKKWLVFSFLIAIALILTKSMGAWLSLILTLIIFIIVLYDQLKKKRWLIAVSFIFIFSILLFIILNRWGRLMDMENPQNSITQRLNYWRAAIGVIKDHPLFGVGPGSFQEVFLQYKTELSTDTRYAHNIFLHQWAETGILGFLGILYVILNSLKKIQAQSAKTAEKLICLSIIAFAFHNLIDNAYFIPEAGLLWWAIMGLIF